jgi:hypothetical protein
MNDVDAHFENALRRGLAAGVEDLAIPDGLGRGGIRRARRRTAKRAAALGVPATAAAVVLAVVLSGGGGVRTGNTTGIDASAVVRRVSDQATRLAAGGGVLETATAGDGQRSREWVYTDPHSGVRYDRAKYFNAHGTYNYGYWNRGRHVGHGRVRNVALELHPLQKTYGVQSGTSSARTSSTVGVPSTARDIVKALRRGRVRLDGETTLAGRRVRRLALAGSQGRGQRTLYVDAATYRPVEEVIHLKPRGHPITDRIFLLPATPANIALARDRPDLDGYRHD